MLTSFWNLKMEMNSLFFTWCSTIISILVPLPVVHVSSRCQPVCRTNMVRGVCVWEPRVQIVWGPPNLNDSERRWWWKTARRMGGVGYLAVGQYFLSAFILECYNLNWNNNAHTRTHKSYHNNWGVTLPPCLHTWESVAGSHGFFIFFFRGKVSKIKCVRVIHEYITSMGTSINSN